ncbi:MAG: class I SAM-dependent methyltransferase [Candidatus Bathyarchaeota archaeon]|uniref:class I SAM-dependent methyltransferase n=1 Tax=Candidatus Bathycorpusculum sp. TaxID=2994959 RepID=UPI00281D430E|nr:class I SAM-dependent methyltransferase [Candidatus Termiticorpusculum sp.]MCL2292398.1 class I SAM-dependent methyltransferase [Candidatus Termiticorpusculum sp.]
MKIKYNFFSFFYDLVDVLYFKRKKYSPRTALLKLISNMPMQVLDICAGTGANSLIIAKNKPDARLIALDLSSNMLKIANKKYRKARVENIETLIADACNISLLNNSFDVVLIPLVLHEIEKNMQKAILTEAKRVLSDNGQIIVVEWEQPKGRFQRAMFSLIKSLEPRGFQNFLHTDLSAYFHTFGLSVLEKHSCDYTQVFVLSKK